MGSTSFGPVLPPGIGHESPSRSILGRNSQFLNLYVSHVLGKELVFVQAPRGGEGLGHGCPHAHFKHLRVDVAGKGDSAEGPVVLPLALGTHELLEGILYLHLIGGFPEDKGEFRMLIRPGGEAVRAKMVYIA